MSNHVVFSRDSEKCRTCEMYEECKNKRMELCAAAYLPTAAMPSAYSMIPDMTIVPNLRDVKIAEITVWKELDMPIQYSVKLVALPEDIARPAGEVLDREKIDIEKEMQKKIEGFAEQIRENSASSVLKTLASPDAAIDAILSQDKFGEVEINDEIRSTVLEYIGRAKEAESESRKKAKSE